MTIDRADARWLVRADELLAAAGTPREQAGLRLGTVVDQLEATGESATALHGSPDEWASQQVAEMVEAQVPFARAPLGPHDGFLLGWAVAALACIVQGVLAAASTGGRTTITAAQGLTPVLLAIAVAALVSGWAVIRRGGSAVVPALGMAILLGASAGVHEAARTTSLGEHSTWWWAVGTVACLALSALVLRLGDPLPAPAPVNLPDEVWLAVAADELTHRGDLLPGQVEGRLREAREFAAEAGTSLSEEFGSPLGFVHALPLDRHPARIRPALLRTLCFGGIAALAVWREDDTSTSVITVTMCLLFVAAAWMRYLRELSREELS